MTLFGMTEKKRTLWRTHSVVCRRCKAIAESLRQTDGEPKNLYLRVGVQTVFLDGLFFVKFKKVGLRYVN